MTKLSELSHQLADIVQNVGASLVTVRGRRRGGSTGVVWDKDHLLASHHALRRETVSVRKPDGSTVDAKVVGRDPATDTALIELKDHGLPLPSWGGEPATGHLALVLGRPRETVRATFGVVGGIGGSWQTPLGAGLDSYIDIDASLPRGFTGGPLVSAEGVLLGLNTSQVVPGGTTIPAGDLPAAVERALKRGSSGKRGYLGVTAQPVRGGGLLVAGIDPDGPAAAAGILVGDIVKTLAGEELTNHAVLLRALGDQGPGTEVVLGLSRSGSEQQVTLALGERTRRRC